MNCSFRLGDLAEIVGGDVTGDPDIEISGVAGIREATSGDITFVANPKYEEYVDTTRASAVIASQRLQCVKPVLRIENPYFAYLTVLNLFAERKAIDYPRGIHESAVVDPTAVIGTGVSIGPFCQVGRHARIGDNTTLVGGAFIGEGVVVGEDCLIYSNVSLREGSEIGNRVILQPGAVIGADGFGYAKEGGTHHKVPQIGRAVIEDDVEIGANSCVDRATTGETRIRRGTKVDNLVQIAHNVIIDEDTIIAAQAGISGSTEVGRGVVVAGQAGLVGHIKIGDGAMLGAQSGVTKDVPSNTSVSGYPAREHGLARRIYAHTAKLPELSRRVKELEIALAELREGVRIASTAEDD